jgi:hypothetical protein
MTIQRYDLNDYQKEWGDENELELRTDGPIVLYADHAEIVTKLEAENAELRLRYTLSDAELPDDFKPEMDPAVRITLYVQYSQAREDVMVEELRRVLEMVHLSEWQKAREILNKIDAEKALMILSQITTEKDASK